MRVTFLSTGMYLLCSLRACHRYNIKEEGYLHLLFLVLRLVLPQFTPELVKRGIILRVRAHSTVPIGTVFRTFAARKSLDGMIECLPFLPTRGRLKYSSSGFQDALLRRYLYFVDPKSVQSSTDSYRLGISSIETDLKLSEE